MNIYSPEGELKLSVDISKYSEAAKSAGAEPEKPEIPAGGLLPIIPVVGIAVVGIVAVGLLVRRRRGNSL